MRHKFFSLILGLFIILTAPAFTSCMEGSKKDNTKQEQALQGSQAIENSIAAQQPIAAEYEYANYVPSQNLLADAGTSGEKATNDIYYLAAYQDESATDAGGTQAGETAPDPPSTIEGVFNWQTILNLVLLVVSTVFASVWKRARNVLVAINKGLEDNNLSKEEISGIVKAWKGN